MVVGGFEGEGGPLTKLFCLQLTSSKPAANLLQTILFAETQYLYSQVYAASCRPAANIEVSCCRSAAKNHVRRRLAENFN